MRSLRLSVMPNMHGWPSLLRSRECDAYVASKNWLYLQKNLRVKKM